MTGGDSGTSSGTSRRPLLKLAAGGAVVGTAGVVARLTVPRRDPGEDGPQGAALVLAAEPGSDVKSLEVPLGDDLLPRTGRRRWESRQMPTSVHSMVAFTWDSGESTPDVRLRSRTASGWGAWQSVPALLDLPDGPETVRRAGSELVWIGRADGVQVRVDGATPQGLALVLLHPSPRASDALVEQYAVGRSLAAPSERASAEVPAPTLITRKEWGANESLRSGKPSYNDTLRQVHVHHTVNSNDYSRSDVPGMIRGMYAYHTQTLGWSDLGYNFLVDRFGRAFVGRAGGPDKLVRGAHTLGFNHNSTGISVIGNYETASPSSATLGTVAALAAWKLHPFGRKPRSKIKVTSEGSDKYSAGRTVSLPVIDGHRDTNDTACPGGNLYAALPKIRRRAARIVGGADAGPDTPTAITLEQTATITGGALLGNTMTVAAGSWTPAEATPTFRWFRGEKQIKGAREQSYEVRPWDVGHRVTCRMILRRDGLEPVTQTPTTGVVRAQPTIGVAASSSKRRVVTVRVTLSRPDDVRPVPSGRVEVRVGERSRTVELVDGVGVVRFGGHRKLGPGRYPVVATYGGDGVFLTTSGTTSVTQG